MFIKIEKLNKILSFKMLFFGGLLIKNNKTE